MFVGVEVGVLVGVDVGVEVGVLVGVDVGVPVGVPVGVEVVKLNVKRVQASSSGTGVEEGGVVIVAPGSLSGALGATDSLRSWYNLKAVNTATPPKRTVATIVIIVTKLFLFIFIVYFVN